MDDHERSLSARGIKAAPRIGAFMHAKTYGPNFVLCSTAARAKQTLELILPYFEREPKIRYDAALYLAGWPELLAEIKLTPFGASPLLVVGHNPGLEQLASKLAREPEGALERQSFQKMTDKFPTAAFAVLEFAVNDWQAVNPGLGMLSDFVRPLDLPKNHHE